MTDEKETTLTVRFVPRLTCVPMRFWIAHA